MEKKLFILFLTIFLINFTYAFDSQTEVICGGDNQLFIQCFGETQTSIIGEPEEKSTITVTPLGIEIKKRGIIFYLGMGIILLILLSILILERRNRKQNKNNRFK